MPAAPLYTDKELFLQIATGNEKAFRIIYDTYFNRVAAYVFKLSKSQTVTEEVVQEVFLKLWIKRVELPKVDHPEAYIFSMARNRAIDYLRTLARETNLVAVLSALVQQPYAADKKLGEKELSRLVNDALQQLSEQKKIIFHLSRHEGLTHDEIAKKLQLSKSTVKNHLSETVKHIRKHLDSNHHTEMLLLLTLFQLK